MTLPRSAEAVHFREKHQGANRIPPPIPSPGNEAITAPTRLDALKRRLYIHCWHRRLLKADPQYASLPDRECADDRWIRMTWTGCIRDGTGETGCFGVSSRQVHVASEQTAFRVDVLETTFAAPATPPSVRGQRSGERQSGGGRMPGGDQLIAYFREIRSWARHR